ncbi:hypothetical protein J4441_00385 [Candidatus Micrarchaeota archaeon]|nr:hypothetical protein [Candidatus Micrarchaeota archaeon]
MKTILWIAAFFAFTQLLGIFVGVVLIENAKMVPEIAELSIVTPAQASDPLYSLVFLFYVIFGAAIILIVTRFYKGMMLFRFLEFFVVATSSAVVFFAFAIVLGLDLIASMLASGILAAIFAGAKFLYARIKNASTIISSAGVGALFGFSVGFIPTLLCVLGLSLYDYIAVFKTRHMITLAKELGTRQLSFSVTAKTLPARREQESEQKYVQRAQKEGERMDLGSGDLAIPLMLAVSAYKLGGIGNSLAIALGSTVGIYLTLWFVSKRRVFLPALPPICLAGIAGLLVYKLMGMP